MSDKKSPSSKRWLAEHFADEYVKKAHKDGYPGRAAYKLLEIQEKEKLLKPGMTVIDLGAAPGGWSKVANQIVGSKGHIIALDILPMDPPGGVTFIQGDFTEDSVLDELMVAVNDAPIDVVLCDIAPNLSGNKTIDQPRSMYLAELALDCALKVLKPGGSFITKIFQGEGHESYVQELRKHFKIVKFRKPKASRARSREVYMIALQKK